MAEPLLIVADIGGTNTRVALADGRRVRPDSIRRYRNADFPGIGEVLARFMDETGVHDTDGTCVAAAGPVRDGVARMTNLDWTIDARALSEATRAEHAAILNDLQAQGHALGHIAPGLLRTVIEGPVRPEETKLVVGLGTGVNAAPVHDTRAGRVVAPSECGHVTLPVRDEAGLRLAQFISRHGPHAHGFAGVEDALSGRGIEHLYAFVTHEAGRPAEANSADLMQRLALGEADARETAAIYVRLLGAFLGDLALIHLPFGGIFLIGGMTRAMAPSFAGMGLSAAFRDKGRFTDFLRSFSVSVVEDDFAALTGCAVHLCGEMAHRDPRRASLS